MATTGGTLKAVRGTCIRTCCTGCPSLKIRRKRTSRLLRRSEVVVLITTHVGIEAFRTGASAERTTQHTHLHLAATAGLHRKASSWSADRSAKTPCPYSSVTTASSSLQPAARHGRQYQAHLTSSHRPSSWATSYQRTHSASSATSRSPSHRLAKTNRAITAPAAVHNSSNGDRP